MTRLWNIRAVKGSLQVLQELILGGVESSAIARRKGLDWKQGFGVYATRNMILIAPVRTDNTLSWHAGGSLFGSWGTKVQPFVNQELPALEEILSREGLISIRIADVRSVELKKPGTWYGMGYVKFILASGKNLKFGILGGNGEYYGERGNEVCDILSAIFRSRTSSLVEEP